MEPPSWESGAWAPFSITGATTSHQIIITPLQAVTPGTYPIGTGVTVRVNQVGGLNAWGINAGSTGTVIFSAVGGSRVAGTFSGVPAPIGSTQGSLTLANGAFDVRLPSS
jgi:hypothetical protein